MDSVYSCKYISLNERVHGHGWVSPGGEATAKELFLKLGLLPGQKVLDIGSGLGGAAFYLANQHGVHVQCVDYCNNMVQLANERLNTRSDSLKSKINFILGDILEMDFPRNSFDAIYSRDVILHITKKEFLFKKMKEWLKPGGKLLLTDFCRGESEPSEAFLQYKLSLKSNMVTIKEEGRMIKEAGFENLEIVDLSEKFIEINKEEMKYMIAAEAATVHEFGKETYNMMTSRWSVKINQAVSKEMAWGLFYATI